MASKGRSFEGLKRKFDFEALRNTGKKTYFSFIILNYRETQNERSRVGFTISKKIGKANLRNKLKRWSKEVLNRQAEIKDKTWDINIIFRPQRIEGYYRKLTYESFKKTFEEAVKKISKSA